MYWRLFIIEDLQVLRLMQQLSPMCIISVHSADWRHHLQFY